MGSAVGQVPEYIQQAAAWCKKFARVPVIVKLTPNITNILPAGEGGEGRRRRCGVADQHAQLDHARRLRHADYLPGHRRQGLARRLLRPGGEADRAAHGRRDRALARNRAACRSPASAASPTGATRSISWRWAPPTCRCARRRWSTASRSSTTWSTACATIWTEGLRVRARPRRQGRAERHRLAVPESQPRRQGVHRPGPVHQVRPLPHRLRRHLAPGHHRHGERRAPLRGDRRRVRGLQSVRQRLPGGELHHDAADDQRRRSAHRAARSRSEKADWTTHPNNPGRRQS